MSGRHTDWPARLRLDPSAFLAPGAVVVGEVTIGARASIWFNTVVRGDSAAIEIGEDSNVQDNSTVHVDEGMPAVVGNRVTIGHRAIVHGCVVGDDSLVGMGAVILSGARIGAGSLIGAASLVREGQVIPPGSLALGSPARVVGGVSDAHRESIRGGAQHYVELSRAYLAKGFARPHPFPNSRTGACAIVDGPMSWAEWGSCLATLAASPGWVGERIAHHDAARVRTAPGAGRWSAHEVLGHLRDADVDVYLPRLERMLTETLPAVPDVGLLGAERIASYAAAETDEVLAAWRQARARLVARLAPLGREDWARVGVHSIRGPFPLGDMVRGWAEHDLGHRHQIAAALEPRP